MAEEQIQLPRLPAVAWDERSQSFSNNVSRKRALNRSEPAPSSGLNSSDPAVFSSDDDPGLDNYANGRRKRRYIGSWYQQQPASSDSILPEPGKVTQTQVTGKRTLARQYDSGVFFGSDGVEEESEHEDKIALPTHWKLEKLRKRKAPRCDSIELAVRDKIRAQLDSGEETIDLWSMGLQQISNHTISLLSQAASVPVVTKGVAFEQKEPELKLYMAKNLLSKVPGSLFDVTNLTILSLRGNQLTELPPGIGKLHKLIELNVSQNLLRFLPAELADLMSKHRKLKSLMIHPNPFLEPDLTAWTRDIGSWEFHSPKDFFLPPSTDGVPEKPLPYLLSCHLMSSPLQVNNSNGRVVSAFKIPSHYRQAVPFLGKEQIEEQQKLLKERSIRVPTLFELALQKCCASPDLDEMARVIPSELSHLRRMLEQASAQRDIGGYSCSKCHRNIVVPTLEWIEWRATAHTSYALNATDIVPSLPGHVLTQDLATPFLYRACSWSCGPDDGPGTQRNLFLTNPGLYT